MILYEVYWPRLEQTDQEGALGYSYLEEGERLSSSKVAVTWWQLQHTALCGLSYNGHLRGEKDKKRDADFGEGAQKAPHSQHGCIECSSSDVQAVRM